MHFNFIVNLVLNIIHTCCDSLREGSSLPGLFRELETGNLEQRREALSTLSRISNCLRFLQFLLLMFYFSASQPKTLRYISCSSNIIQLVSLKLFFLKNTTKLFLFVFCFFLVNHCLFFSFGFRCEL